MSPGFEDSGDEAENLFALSQDRRGFLLGHKLRELCHFDLREHFGAGTFRDEVEPLGILLHSSFVAFSDIAGNG